jgi:hypothetical protein
MSGRASPSASAFARSEPSVFVACRFQISRWVSLMVSAYKTVPS